MWFSIGTIDSFVVYVVYMVQYRNKWQSFVVYVVYMVQYRNKWHSFFIYVVQYRNNAEFCGLYGLV